jgi:glycine cleavage system transcriptional repressor
LSRNFFLVSVFGKDRAGMVAGITQALVAVNGNLADASMTRLGGEFSMMMVCDVPKKTTLAALVKTFRPWEKKLALQISVKPISQALAQGARPSSANYLISVYGSDRAGLVHPIVEALAKRKISITDLNTRVLRQPPAKPLYVMLLEVVAPPDLDVDEFREELDRLRQTLGVDLTLQDIEPVAL